MIDLIAPLTSSVNRKAQALLARNLARAEALQGIEAVVAQQAGRRRMILACAAAFSEVSAFAQRVRVATLAAARRWRWRIRLLKMQRLALTAVKAALDGVRWVWQATWQWLASLFFWRRP